MIPEKDFTCAFSHETYIGGKPLGVKIYIAAGREPTDEERNVSWRAGENVFNEVWKNHILSDPIGIANAAKEKEDILKLFEGKNIFVEEITNGYCSQPCCANLPWFVVTTAIGPVVIGWRKRVINIDWSRTIQKKAAAELFPTEDVTKGEQYIHAWGYEKAKEYVDKLHREVLK